jgi:hypothetical protein
LNTLQVLVTQAPAGLTVGELEQRLQTRVANLLSRLVQQGQLAGQVLPGRRVVYLSPVAEQGRRQWEQRQQVGHAASVASAGGLPAGCPAAVVIAVLRQMIVAPDQGPEQWARQIQAQGGPVSVGQVRRVQEHYGVEKKRRN